MDSNNLEELKKRLYKKGESFQGRGKRVRIFGGKEKIPSSYWQSASKERKKIFRPLKLVFILVSIFFLISLAALAYFWLGGSNIVSSRNIDMEIRGPVYSKGGEIINIDVLIENKNNTTLELADLIIDFPQGSFSPDGNEMRRERYSLDEINPGESIKKSISLTLFGEEEEEKKIIAILEYRLAESNAIFAKETEYIIKISQPTIGVSLSMPKEANSGQEIEMEIGLVSNSETTIKNLILQIEYPSGFQFVSAAPEPARRDSIWQIGDIEPSQERSITLRGIIEGQDLEEKAFRVITGINNDEGILLAYGASSETITLKKPYIDLVLFIDAKDSGETIAFSGDSMRAELAWKNNLSVPVSQVVIEIKIKGKALDEKSISASNGAYRAFDKTLIWNSSSMTELASIEPGETGRARFSFSVLEELPVSQISDKNFIIILESKIDGQAVAGGAEDAEIHNDITKEIKIGSRLQMVNMALYYSGPFNNTGPMPPKVGQETTYTITWSFGNAVNDFSDVEVKTSLPSYIRWLGNISPQSEDVSFDETTGEVMWKAGDISAGIGIIQPAREVAFQIALSPSIGQVGASPDLITETFLEARDKFINQVIKDKKRALSTRLLNDPKFSQQESKVSE